MVFRFQKCWDSRHFLDAFFKARDFFFLGIWQDLKQETTSHLDLVFVIQKDIESNCRWCLLAFRQIKGQVFSDFTGHKRGHRVIRISRTIICDNKEFSVSDKWSHQDFTSCRLLDIHSRILYVAFNISLGICHGDDGSKWASPKDFDRNFSISFLVCCQDLTGNEGTAKCDRGASLCMMFFLGCSYSFCTV